MSKVIFAIFVLLVFIEQLVIIYRYFRPHGLLHIDEYQDKDVYRMLYFLPVEDLKVYHRLNLKVEVQKWNELSGVFNADFIPEDYK